MDFEKDTEAFETTEDSEEFEHEDGLTDALHEIKTEKGVNSVAVAAIIFGITVLFFIIWYMFFNQDITGTWKATRTVELADGSGKTAEVTTYIDFSDTARMTFFPNEKSYFSDGEAAYAQVKQADGGAVYTGSYMTRNDNGENVLHIYFPSIGQVMSNSYTIRGNIFTGKELVFKTDSEEMIYRNAEMKVQKPEVEKDFKPNKDIIGSWSADGVVYDFNDDGTFVCTQDTAAIEGVYSFTTVNDTDAISFKYIISGQEDVISYPYTLKDGKLYLGSGFNATEFSKI